MSPSNRRHCGEDKDSTTLKYDGLETTKLYVELSLEMLNDCEVVGLFPLDPSSVLFPSLPIELK
jgi:hypothetical protein